MSENSRFYELFRKIAALEKRVARLEDGYQELDNILDPQGWIGEAFKLIEQDMEEMSAKMEARFQSVDEKLDIILTHITSLNR